MSKNTDDSVVTDRSRLDNEDEGQGLTSGKIHRKRKTPQQELDEKKEKLQKFLEWLKIKLEATLWVGGSIFLIYYSNFFKQLFDNENINEIFFGIFMISVGINVMIAIYVTLILPYCLKVKEEFDVHSPRIVYVGAISGVLCVISLIISIWPVFGFWSPFMVLVFLLGYINSAHFLPNNQFGSILFGGIFIGAFFSHLFIEHDGMLH